MRFCDTHRHKIALTVIFPFLFLLQISVQPLNTAPSNQQTGITQGNDKPGLFEKNAPDVSSSSMKKSSLPIILGVIAVGAVAAVLILVVFKTKYDITGKWSISVTYNDDSLHQFDWIDTMTFSGSKKSGTTSDEYGGTGNYNVDGKNVTFNIKQWPNSNGSNFTGKFDDKDKMSGTFSELRGETGNWTAIRGSTISINIRQIKSSSKHGPGL